MSAAALVAAFGLGAAALTPLSAAPADAVDTTRARADEVGLFADTEPRRAVTSRGRRPVEVGLQFRSRATGVVTGAQVYKTARGKGATPRRASLWNARGERLAAARLTPRRGAGWVSVRFPTAVAIKANRTYTVSVFAPKGRTAITKGGLRKPKQRGPLTAGGKLGGVHAYSTSSRFPRRAAQDSNHWVDVLFRRSGNAPTPMPTPTATPTATPTTNEGAFPTQDTTGVPAGWSPTQVVDGAYRITTPGAVVEDLRVSGSIEVAAPNVTIRRVEVIGGSIDNFVGPTCQGGLLVEDTTIRRGTGTTRATDPPALGAGGYTARRVEIDGKPEGFRVGGRASGCGPVVIESSWARVVRPDECGDWHGDGIQGYDGPALTVRQTSLILDETGCGGTAPFFYPHSQGNTSVDIDGLLVDGGGYAFRLGMPGSVRNLAIVDKSWYYGPINVKCSAVGEWQADVVTVAADGVATPVRAVGCTTEEGN
ncbi:DUF4082 domain-containing protein [Nocardioides sp. S5]|uniref:DUF4082 domain-containing protein n=1 Tax=Nocardioides sp. S5 TaxID=2017486 RepID=UPI001A8DE325|nr:DUF4082 domain-containing protein [Nocardioides sp. S5]